MPTAVTMEESFDKLQEQCEAQELEVRSRRFRVMRGSGPLTRLRQRDASAVLATAEANDAS